MLPEFLTQKFITGVIREFPVEGFLGNEILPLEGVASMEVVYDVIKKDAKLAPFIAMNAESTLADKANFKRVTQELAAVRIKELLNEEEILSLREPGQPELGIDGLAATRAAVAERYLRTTAERMSARVNSRVEWMRWEALAKGKIDYKTKDVNFSVDFGIPSGQKITLHTTDRWSETSTADPLGDIAEWMEIIRKAARRPVTRMYVGGNVQSYLVQNEKIRQLLSGSELVAQMLSPAGVLDFLGMLMGIKIMRYDISYQSDAGSDATFLPDDYIVMMCEPKQPDGEVLGDVMTGPAKANNYQTGLYGWVKEEEDPWATYIGAGIHAFPRIYHPNWILSANVKDAT
ncbi:MAG: major capsid protein [Armatimonadota bacterium]|jgi:hypothetical protein